MNAHFADGTPLTSGFTADMARSVNAAGWIAMLAAPKLWAALRRIPPKSFILECVDIYREYAKSPRRYFHIPDGQPGPDLRLRAAAVEHLRHLLLEWEPPLVTPEIREAARAVHFAETGTTPEPSWDDQEHDMPGLSLEATLIWPEGQWNENAFVAERRNGGAF